MKIFVEKLVLEQALEALEKVGFGDARRGCDEAVGILRAALSQQDKSEMYAAAYSSACGELRKVEAQRDALLELVAEMNQHEGVEWSEDLHIKINSALMQALEALAWKAGSEPALYGAQTLQAITALRAALAQQDEPVDPVAWMCSSPELIAKGYKRFSSRRDGDWNIPVYLSPPQRKPLTQEESDMTETDLELLDLAAKAAGIHVFRYKNELAYVDSHGGFIIWNPLSNYGDALMLAEKLELCLDMRGSEAWVGRYPIELGNNGVDDADVRRAIVLVAAEIGRKMK